MISGLPVRSAREARDRGRGRRGSKDGMSGSGSQTLAATLCPKRVTALYGCERPSRRLEAQRTRRGYCGSQRAER
jgi:hypothetical protein